MRTLNTGKLDNNTGNVYIGFMTKTSAAGRVQRIDGAGCFQEAQKMARYGHRDWIVWSDADGSHAALKTIPNVELMIAAEPSSWSLISADSGVPMKGFDWLATNLIANMQRGF